MQVSPGWLGCALRRMSNNPARDCTFSISRELLFNHDFGRDWYWNNSSDEDIRER